MKLKKDKKIALTVSVVWLAIALISLLIILHDLRFPVIDFNIFPIILMFAFPIMGIVFSVIPDNYIKPVLYASLGVCFALFTVYITLATWGFTQSSPFYPISVSATDETENYLKLDDLNNSYEEDFVRRVFPEKIPSNASDASYSYECEPFKFSWKIEASWVIPKEEYDRERERISHLTAKKIEKGERTYYDLSNDGRYGHVCFDDEECSVQYVDILGYYFDYRKVSGIGDWE